MGGRQQAVCGDQISRRINQGTSGRTRTWVLPRLVGGAWATPSFGIRSTSHSCHCPVWWLVVSSVHFRMFPFSVRGALCPISKAGEVLRLLWGPCDMAPAILGGKGRQYVTFYMSLPPTPAQ